MTVPFVASLRSRPGTIALGEGPGVLRLRVEMPEVWDTVRVNAAPSELVRAVKLAALAALAPDAANPDELVIKLGGFEVLDEDASLQSAGAKDGSIFLLTYRRRRPVRSG